MEVKEEVLEIIIEKTRDWILMMRPYVQLLGSGVELIDEHFYSIMADLAEFMGASKDDYEYCWDCAYEQAKAIYEDNGEDWFKQYL